MKVSAVPIIAGIEVFLMAFPAMAADHQVRMLNKDSEGRPMQFEPAFLKIAPGDTVTFVPTDKGHNSESIPAMSPADAERWKGKIGEEITVAFSTEGFYAYKCTPHLGLGMVGLIQVGENPTQLDPAEIEKLPPKPEERLLDLIAAAGGP